MRTIRNQRRPAPRFEAPTRFRVEPFPAAPFRETTETELEQLKDRLLRESLAQAGNAELNAPLRRASNDAAALAWTTPFPLLLLPELFREKAESARRYVRKQASLLPKRRSPSMGQAA